MAAPKKPAAKSRPKAKARPAAAAPAAAKAGRGTRWTDADVRLLMDAVSSSATAKSAFEAVSKQLGKSVGTVQQKYYNLQKKTGAAPKRRGRPAGSTSAGASSRSTASGAGSSGVLTTTQLRGLSVDDLVGLASRVKDEVDRRKRELDAAAKLFG